MKVLQTLGGPIIVSRDKVQEEFMLSELNSSHLFFPEDINERISSATLSAS
mgnify:CR=1 FL=1